MRYIILLLLTGLMAIYQPNSIIPKFYLEKRGDEYKVYRSNQIVVPAFIIRNNKVYRAGEILPLLEIQDRKEYKK